MTKRLKVKVEGQWFDVQITDLSTRPIKVLVDGEPVEVEIEPTGHTETVQQSGFSEDVTTDEAQATGSAEAPAPPKASAIRTFRSPMPGVILSVAVEKGQQVVTGDEVCVLEAMKMQQSLRADWSGIVKVVHVKEGQQVLGGDPILELD